MYNPSALAAYDLNEGAQRPSASDAASREFDIAVVGAGLAGALLALHVARQGRRVVVIDPRSRPRAEFRCEKLGTDQIAVLEELGLLHAVESGLAPGERLASSGFRYDQVVNAVRAAWPQTATFIDSHVTDIVAAEGGNGQQVVCGDRAVAQARLVALATGLSPRLLARLGMQRRHISDQHSVCLGVTLRQTTACPVALDGLLRHGERAGDRVAFVSVFRAGEHLRANMFTYHHPRDPWVRLAKQAPLAAIGQVLPGLRRALESVEVVEPAELWVTDIYRVENPTRPGIVLIGDAFQTSCPSTAYGVTRLLSDIKILMRDHLDDWLQAPSIGPAEISAFYDNPSKTAVDAEGLGRAMTAREAAVSTGFRWRAYRLAVSAKRRLKALASRLARAPSGRLKPGDVVRVRSAAEILRTLDAAGKRHGLPFMPEMVPCCGKEFRVARTADKTCFEGLGLRGMRNTVHLEDARCDGAAHDGCERGCSLFWNEAWLAPAGTAPAVYEDGATDAAARRMLEQMSVRSGDRYFCQSTELATASFELPRWNLGHLLLDVRRGELSWRGLAAILGRILANLARRRMGLAELQALKGSDGASSRELGLRPGDRVRVRSKAEIARTLDARGRNRGLSFEPEMASYAGHVYTVARPIRRIILEKTGKLATLSSTVTLEGLSCRGTCARNCPRANPLYWREIWLERVEHATRRD